MLNFYELLADGLRLSAEMWELMTGEIKYMTG